MANFDQYFDQELDACGLNCPMPILRTKKALNIMQKGQILHIIATDPGSWKDIPVFAKQTGNTLLEFSETEGKYHYFIQKS